MLALHIEMKTDPWRVEEIRWDSPQAEHARRIRRLVFVEELGLPLSEECDTVDITAYHVIVYDHASSPCGTARLYKDLLRPSCARIGRVAVMPHARGKGCGKALIEHLVSKAKSLGFHKVVLAAQEQSLGFYLRLGFIPYGAHYLDASLAHQDMVRYLIDE